MRYSTDKPITVHRRTFEAATFPKGSAERAEFNRDALTSEYYPSLRYITSDGCTYRRKCDAEEYARTAQ